MSVPFSRSCLGPCRYCTSMSRFRYPTSLFPTQWQATEQPDKRRRTQTHTCTERQQQPARARPTQENRTSCLMRSFPQVGSSLHLHTHQVFLFKRFGLLLVALLTLNALVILVVLLPSRLSTYCGELLLLRRAGNHTSKPSSAPTQPTVSHAYNLSSRLLVMTHTHCCVLSFRASASGVSAKKRKNKQPSSR